MSIPHTDTHESEPAILKHDVHDVPFEVIDEPLILRPVPQHHERKEHYTPIQPHVIHHEVTHVQPHIIHEVPITHHKEEQHEEHYKVPITHHEESHSEEHYERSEPVHHERIAERHYPAPESHHLEPHFTHP